VHFYATRRNSVDKTTTKKPGCVTGPTSARWHALLPAARPKSDDVANPNSRKIFFEIFFLAPRLLDDIYRDGYCAISMVVVREISLVDS